MERGLGIGVGVWVFLDWGEGLRATAGAGGYGKSCGAHGSMVLGSTARKALGVAGLWHCQCSALAQE